MKAQRERDGAVD